MKRVLVASLTVAANPSFPFLNLYDMVYVRLPLSGKRGRFCSIFVGMGVVSRRNGFQESHTHFEGLVP